MKEEIKRKAVAHIVKMMSGNGGEKWNGDAPMHEGVCGWGGVMSPMNRPAFVATYGLPLTEELEALARADIEGRKNWWRNSKACSYEGMADNAEVNDPGAYEVGTFVWGLMDGCKCDHEDLRRVFRHLIADDGSKNPPIPRLVRVIRIEDVEDIERDAATLLNGWKPQGEEGGSNSDDVTEEEVGKMGEKWRSLTDEQKRSFYTLAVLVRDNKGKFFLIDPEGFDYPRYVILPKEWRKMYAATVAEVTAQMEAEAKAKAEAAAKAEAEAHAAYLARCAKWEGLMEKVPDGTDEYDREYRKVGKRNVVAMAKAAFPWVRFSVSCPGGWGHGYRLSWKNGPSVEEVCKATDFGLFQPWADTFDGMTDCAGTDYSKFTEFSDKFGGIGNGVECSREECETDNNGDPNGKPPKPPKPKAEVSNGDCVTVTENKAKHGIEIRFPAMPSEAVRNFMKGHGWRWSRYNGGFWYNRASEETRRTAAEVVAMWNAENGVEAA